MNYGRRNNFPSTTLGEQRRQGQLEQLGNPDINESTQYFIGTISKVHDTKPWIKAYSKTKKHDLAGGRWIPLIHSPNEIVEKWGTIRIGMDVQITSTGLSGEKSIATIINNEDEDFFTDTIEENKKQVGLWKIFTPGV